jgi:hypothetical protein
MASEVSICNLSLSHLGDTARVTSIKPPDNSVQARLCAQFYPIARDALLEMSAYGFATRRAKLAQVDNPSTTWLYAYAVPNGMLNALAVLPADAMDDYEAQLLSSDASFFPQGYVPAPMSLAFTPQPYAIETNDDGSQIILTNVQDAVFRFTTFVSDTTKFSPLFTLALSYLLASHLAGPIIKGDEGRAVAAQMLEIFASFQKKAESSDANQRKVKIEASPSWLRGR